MESGGKMKHKSLIGLILAIIGVLAGFGIIPAVWGPVASVVSQNLDMIPIEKIADRTMQATIVRVIDGDTVEVDLIPPGDELEMLRLIGVDTPETVHPALPIQFFGPEATRFVKNICLGQVVTLHLQKDGPDRGRYERLLVYVELPDGTILNEAIISNGFGYSYTKYKHAKTAEYNQLQKTAIAGKRGLWAGVKFDDLPVWLRKSNPDILKQ